MSTEKHNQNVVVRFAPSPTGLFHIGSARAALFNELYARRMNGKFILRIEDTDKKRSESRYEESIRSGMDWLGMKYDEFYRQSERFDIYRGYLQKLIDSGNAYVSKEETGESSEVVRFKNPGRKIKFEDLIRGSITVDTSDLGDFIIAKNLETPLYNFAVAVDDFEMGISHVIRGDDGISNTPRQILIQEALGYERPQYAHIPLILDTEKKKLSKRFGAVSVDEYRERGYLSEAMVNFLAFLGWNPGTDQEFFTHEELRKAFDLSRVGKSGAIFNIEKLDWFNKMHLKKNSREEIHEKIQHELGGFYEDEKLGKILPKISETIVDRITTLNDVRRLAEEGEFDMFFKTPEYKEPILLVNPKERSKNDEGEGNREAFQKTRKNIDEIIKLLSEIPETKKEEGNFNAEYVKETIWDFAEKAGKGSVLWPMRYALSGREKSPDPFTIAWILGFGETISRLQNASMKLK